MTQFVEMIFLFVFLAFASCPCYGISVYSRGALSYVVEQGCPFLAHYVRDNYYDFVPFRRQATIAMTTPSSHINWVQYVHDILVADYVPIELFKGLVNCGKEYALYAVNAPGDLRATLRVDYHNVPGLVGR